MRGSVRAAPSASPPPRHVQQVLLGLTHSRVHATETTRTPRATFSQAVLPTQKSALMSARRGQARGPVITLPLLPRIRAVSLQLWLRTLPPSGRLVR